MNCSNLIFYFGCLALNLDLRSSHIFQYFSETKYKDLKWWLNNRFEDLSGCGKQFNKSFSFHFQFISFKPICFISVPNLNSSIQQSKTSKQTNIMLQLCYHFVIFSQPFTTHISIHWNNTTSRQSLMIQKEAYFEIGFLRHHDTLWTSNFNILLSKDAAHPWYCLAVSSQLSLSETSTQHLKYHQVFSPQSNSCPGPSCCPIAGGPVSSNDRVD